MKWSEFFTDSKLNTLIDTALKNNQELNIVSLEVDIAQNEIMARRGEYLPKVAFRMGAGIDKVGQYTSQGASDDANGVPANLPNFAFGFSASWEIDVWSKLRNATKAATLRYLASKEGRNFERAVLNGYTEVIKLLAKIHNLEMSYDLQAQQVAKLIQSIGISSQLFARARADYMEVLLTRRDALEAQMDLIENKKRQMNASVGLYQALGGGWR